MALSGAPSSPSIVGILVSTARGYDKIVHFELATERVIECGIDGKFLAAVDANEETGSILLVKEGIRSALQAGVQSIGVTNLCKPDLIPPIFQPFRSPAEEENNDTIMTALPFHPTAVIFVPYHAFYAWAYLIAGSTCDIPALPCWDPSFAAVETFGHGSLNREPGTCAVDATQYPLIQVWDELRTRHNHVQVVGDVDMLTDELLSAAQERVVIKFSCVMETRWSFPQGEETQAKFQKVASRFSFQEHVAHPAGSTSSGEPICADGPRTPPLSSSV